MKIKKYLKKNMFLLIIILTLLTKILEWGAQYFIYNGLEHIKSIWFFQIGFILLVSSVLYFGFNYIGVKKQYSYLTIPALSYFIKEVYNFIFVYGRVLNYVTIIALFLEPMFLYGLIIYLNKSWLKIK